MRGLALFLCLVPVLAAAQTDPEFDRLFGPAAGSPPAVRVGDATTPDAVERDSEQRDVSPGSRFSLAPWSVAHEDLGGGRHRLRFELATLHTGGDGEVRARVVRWAEAMVRHNGLAGYEIARMEEGIESGWFFGQRYAEVEVRFIASETFGVF